MTRPRFFTAAEVAAHNTAADLWVSFLGRVCDLSPLVTRFAGELPRWAGPKLKLMLSTQTSVEHPDHQLH